ncbi:hypothetical protein QJS04_geneDACA021320 [Acorus gramineus]|uniref:Btz domain-containing protein n=1 Tax=Acorus gramineus TaxID=55184 RepID=A0AAV9AJY7_ACOGR|nr:hypothetical protein QJS04_geneDACA021320 [Acorus gramineus]
MATEEREEPADYESDPEDSLLPSAMRRREASDDEGEEEGRRTDRRVVVGSDGESDGQGGAGGYEEEELEEEEYEEEEEEYEERRSERGGDGGGEVLVPIQVARKEEEEAGEVIGGDAEGVQEKGVEGVEGEGEKKENEPFAVPTAGAFYMHDDRFRDSGGPRHRRTPGGRRLWESKDNKAWVHDRFEEMSLQDAHYNERKVSRGRFRGRGKNRVNDHGYIRENRSRVYEDNNQNWAPKTVRGRGPRRYQPLWKSNNEMPTSQQKQSVKSYEATSNKNSLRPSSNTSNARSDPAPPRKQVFASSLNSASPPFYPSGSSNQDTSIVQKRDGQSGNTNRNLPSSVLEKNHFSSQSSAPLRGKATIDPIGQDKFYYDGSVRGASMKPLNNSHSFGSSSSVNPSQSYQSRNQGRALSIPGQSNYQPNSSTDQVNRGSVQTQVPVVQRKPVLNRVQSVPSAPQLSGGSHPVSAPQALSSNSSEIGEVESPSGSSKSKTALVVKGKTSVVQGSGRGSFMYGGAQVIGVTGAMGGGAGDQSFPTPALLPVMQFGGQHPGGLGVPAVGMALPGYVSQPGFGNSEMTWVPVLAGAAGAMGASYPYIALDGGYYARPPGQISSSTPSGYRYNVPNFVLEGYAGPAELVIVIKEASTNKSTNVGKTPPQKPEIVNDEFGQRQNKPRRYSEMNFGQ